MGDLTQPRTSHVVYNILDKVEVIMDIYDKEAYSVDVGTRLRQLREERNMSMRALATASS